MNVTHRERFVALVRELVGRLGAIRDPAELLAGAEHAPDLCIELERAGFVLRFHHRASPESASRALVEIVGTEPPQRNAEAVLAAMLALNASEWPAAYALDAATGRPVHCLPFELEHTPASAVSHVIETTCAAFAALHAAVTPTGADLRAASAALAFHANLA